MITCTRKLHAASICGIPDQHLNKRNDLTTTAVIWGKQSRTAHKWKSKDSPALKDIPMQLSYKCTVCPILANCFDPGSPMKIISSQSNKKLNRVFISSQLQKAVIIQRYIINISTYITVFQHSVYKHISVSFTVL